MAAAMDVDTPSGTNSGAGKKRFEVKKVGRAAGSEGPEAVAVGRAWARLVGTGRPLRRFQNRFNVLGRGRAGLGMTSVALDQSVRMSCVT